MEVAWDFGDIGWGGAVLKRVAVFSGQTIGGNEWSAHLKWADHFEFEHELQSRQPTRK